MEVSQIQMTKLFHPAWSSFILKQGFKKLEQQKEYSYYCVFGTYLFNSKNVFDLGSMPSVSKIMCLVHLIFRS